MTPFILVAYATKKGSTEEVAREITGRLAERGIVTDLRAAHDVESLDGYDGVVLGSAIYTGKLHADARSFLRRYREELAALPLAVFAMGPRTLDEHDVSASRAQLDAELAKLPGVEPFATVIFGGAFDPAEHRFPFNRMPASDVRDWIAIRAWGEQVADAFAGTHALAASVG